MVSMYCNNSFVEMTVQEVIDALEKVPDKSKWVTTGETGGTIIQVIEARHFVLLNKEFYGPINLDNKTKVIHLPL